MHIKKEFLIIPCLILIVLGIYYGDILAGRWLFVRDSVIMDDSSGWGDFGKYCFYLIFSVAIFVGLFVGKLLNRRFLFAIVLSIEYVVILYILNIIFPFFVSSLLSSVLSLTILFFMSRIWSFKIELWTYCLFFLYINLLVFLISKMLVASINIIFFSLGSFWLTFLFFLDET